MTTVEHKLAERGLILPEPALPLASYVPSRKVGSLIFISGQLPFRNGELIQGRLGEDLTTEEGALAAEACGVMIVSQLKHALGGDLGRAQCCIKLDGFVACTPMFTDHPEVINGASNLMEDLFADRGRHARAAVGCPSLPRGAAVEVAAVFAID
ncbi:MAG: RidA family protein [Pseudomonadota bacterium]